MKPIEETEFFNTLTPEIHLTEESRDWILEGDMRYLSRCAYDPNLESKHDAKVRLAEQMRHFILKQLGVVED